METILPGSAEIVASGGVLVPGEGDASSNIREHTLSAGDDTFTVDYSDAGLTDAPRKIAGLGPVEKTASGQANLYATLIAGSATETGADFELNAPCDVTGRKFQYILVP
jgi:hypothetical protein